MLHLLPMNPTAKQFFLDGHVQGYAARTAGILADKRCRPMVTFGYPYWHGYQAGFNLTPGLDAESERAAAVSGLDAYIKLAMKTDDIVKHGKPWKIT